MQTRDFRRNPTIKTLLLLPLDERPINAAYPQLLAEAAGLRCRVPENLLGARKQPAETSRLASWLTDEAPAAAGAVLSLDMLAWGGLIPSRQSDTDLDAALANLDGLRRLRATRPDLPLLGFSTIQRVNRSDDDGEEPTYCRQHGRDIFRRSVLEHRERAGVASGEEIRELEELRSRLPGEVWADQLAIRGRTRAVNFRALDLLEDGVLDFLVFNQDDTTTWGLNVMIREELEAEIRRRGLTERALVYPGADEVAQVLMARLVTQLHGRSPAVSVFYSSRSGPGVQTAYEDRPLADLVAMHLQAAGATAVPAGAPPDWFLGVNSPSRAQGQGGMQYALQHAGSELDADQRTALEEAEAPVHGVDRLPGAFAATLGRLAEDGATVSLADVAHVNGADDELMRLVAAGGSLGHLSGYGGWNTAGNALGSAVALGVIAALMPDRDNLRLAVAARLLDDWLYQARVRARLLLTGELRDLGFAVFLEPGLLSKTEDKARGWLNAELAAFRLPYRVSELSFPWKRVFEIAYTLEELP